LSRSNRSCGLEGSQARESGLPRNGDGTPDIAEAAAAVVEDVVLGGEAVIHAGDRLGMVRGNLTLLQATAVIDR
jgi:hypothetical protein